MKKTKIAMLMAVGAFSMLGAAAHAAPTYCSAGSHPDGIGEQDVRFESQSASDCYGVVSGNINSLSDLTRLDLSWDTAGYSLLGHTDAGQSPSGVTFNGLRFTVSADEDTTGEWQLTATDVGDPLDLPTQLDLIVGLKASNRYALWLLEEVTITGNNEGRFDIRFTNRGGNVPDLSHIIVFGRAVDGGSGTPVGTLPEPGALSLLGFSLAALGMGRRRRVPGSRREVE